jgi:hypothetical protein
LFQLYVKAQAIEEKRNVKVEAVLIENLAFYGKAYSQHKGQLMLRMLQKT